MIVELLPRAVLEGVILPFVLNDLPFQRT